MVRKTLSVVTASVFLLVNVIFAHAAETSLWRERRNNQWAALPAGFGAAPSASELLRQIPALGKALGGPRPAIPQSGLPLALRGLLSAIPVNAGKIKEVYASHSSRPPVLLIQDVHMNREAQENIAAMMKAMSALKISIGVEGASGPFDFDDFRRFPDRKVMKAVADTYLHANRIAAPSYFGITAQDPVPAVVGIDDAFHYKANVDAYKNSLSLQKSALQSLASERRALGAEKAVLNDALKQFDARRDAYETGALSFGDYVSALARIDSVSSGAGLELVIEQFNAAFQMEKSLDFTEVERQRARVVEKLAHKMAPAELKELLADSVAYRMGEMSYAAYYKSVRSRIDRHGIQLSAYPAFDQYVRYVLLADGIDAEKLFKAVQRREAEILSALCRSPLEKELMRRSHAVALKEKLVNFALTPDEWEEYRRQVTTLSLSSFEAFYREADIRSERMVNNLAPLGSAPVVMLVGGFHTPQVTKLLKERGVSFAVLQPRITKTESLSGTGYLSIFSREKTPLEKLFQGEKLFMAPNSTLPGGPAASGPVAAEMVAVAAPFALSQPGEAYDCSVAKSKNEKGIIQTEIVATGAVIKTVLKTLSTPVGAIEVPIESLGSVEFLAPELSVRRWWKESAAAIARFMAKQLPVKQISVRADENFGLSADEKRVIAAMVNIMDGVTEGSVDLPRDEDMPDFLERYFIYKGIDEGSFFRTARARYLAKYLGLQDVKKLRGVVDGLKVKEIALKNKIDLQLPAIRPSGLSRLQEKLVFALVNTVNGVNGVKRLFPQFRALGDAYSFNDSVLREYFALKKNDPTVFDVYLNQAMAEMFDAAPGLLFVLFNADNSAWNGLKGLTSKAVAKVGEENQTYLIGDPDKVLVGAALRNKIKADIQAAGGASSISAGFNKEGAVELKNSLRLTSPRMETLLEGIATALTLLFTEVEAKNIIIRAAEEHQAFHDFTLKEILGKQQLPPEVKDYFSRRPGVFFEYIDDDLISDLINNLGGKSGRPNISSVLVRYFTGVYRFETANDQQSLDDALKGLLHTYKFSKAVELGRVKVFHEAENNWVYQEEETIAKLSPKNTIVVNAGTIEEFKSFVDKQIEADTSNKENLYVYRSAYKFLERLWIVTARHGRLELHYASATYTEITGQWRFQHEEGAIGVIEDGKFSLAWFLKPSPENAHDWPLAVSSKVNELIKAGSLVIQENSPAVDDLMNDLHVQLRLAYGPNGYRMSKMDGALVYRNQEGARLDFSRYPTWSGMAIQIAQNHNLNFRAEIIAAEKKGQPAKTNGRRVLTTKFLLNMGRWTAFTLSPLELPLFFIFIFNIFFWAIGSSTRWSFTAMHEPRDEAEAKDIRIGIIWVNALTLAFTLAVYLSLTGTGLSTGEMIEKLLISFGLLHGIIHIGSNIRRAWLDRPLLTLGLDKPVAVVFRVPEDNESLIPYVSKALVPFLAARNWTMVGELDSPIGKGTFGKVFEVTVKTTASEQIQLAVKLAMGDEGFANASEALEKDVTVLKKVYGEHIQPVQPLPANLRMVDFYGVVNDGDKDNPHPILVVTSKAKGIHFKDNFLDFSPAAKKASMETLLRIGVLIVESLTYFRNQDLPAWDRQRSNYFFQNGILTTIDYGAYEKDSRLLTYVPSGARDLLRAALPSGIDIPWQWMQALQDTYEKARKHELNEREIRDRDTFNAELQTLRQSQQKDERLGAAIGKMEKGSALDSASLLELVRVFSPQAKSVELANADNAETLTTLQSQSTENTLPYDLPALLLLLKAKDKAVSMDTIELKKIEEDQTKIPIHFEVRSAKTVREAEALLLGIPRPHNPKGRTLVALPDEILEGNVLSVPEWIVVISYSQIPLSPRKLAGFFKEQMSDLGALSVVVSRRASIHPELAEILGNLVENYKGKADLYMLLDEATRLVIPMAVSDLAHVADLQRRLVAIQA